MSAQPASDAHRVAKVVATIIRRLSQQPPGQPGTVVRVGSGTPGFRAALSEALAKQLERPVFRLAPEDLVAAPVDRMAAVLRLLDAAEVAGAVTVVDAADHVAQDAAASVGLSERLAHHRGLVVLATDDLDESDDPLGDRDER